jgi:hypothetical protein
MLGEEQERIKPKARAQGDGWQGGVCGDRGELVGWVECSG